MIKGIHRILSFTNEVGDDSLLLEQCGDYIEALRGYSIVLPRDKFSDMCNLMTVFYHHNKEVCFKTFDEGEDERIVQLCNTLKGKESYTSMFVEAYGGITSLISSSVGGYSKDDGLVNPLSRLNIGDKSDEVDDEFTEEGFSDDDFDEGDLGSLGLESEESITEETNVYGDYSEDSFSNESQDNSQNNLQSNYYTDDEEDPEVIAELQQEIEMLKNSLAHKDNEISTIQQKYDSLSQSFNMVRNDLHASNNSVQALQIQLEQTQPYVACFDGVDVTAEDMQMCMDLVRQVGAEQLRTILLNIISDGGLNPNDKGKCLVIIKLVDALFAAGLFG